MEEVQIIESRIKILLFLAGSLVFTAGFMLLPDPNNPPSKWGGWFFGLAAVVFLALLLRPRKLTLTSVGFTLSGGLSRKALMVEWRDVVRFYPMRIGAGSSMVGFHYSAEAKNRPRAAWLANRISGADGGIGGAWPLSASALADKLNAYRERALAQS